MKITFEAHPIETAPKGRTIMVYAPAVKRWAICRWHNDIEWVIPPFRTATHWAEIDDMRPGVSEQGEQP